MTAPQRHALVAAFPTRSQAELAIDKLWHEGFKPNHIGMAGPGQEWQQADTPTGPLERTAGHGAAIGAMTGGSLGAIAGGLIAGLIPGVGPVLAGGLLAGIVTGAAAGAAAGSYLGPFVAMEWSAPDVQAFHHHLQAGQILVAVQPEDRFLDALTILRNHGGKIIESSPSVATPAHT